MIVKNVVICVLGIFEVKYFNWIVVVFWKFSDGRMSMLYDV